MNNDLKSTAWRVLSSLYLSHHENMPDHNAIAQCENGVATVSIANWGSWDDNNNMSLKSYISAAQIVHSKMNELPDYDFVMYTKPNKMLFLDIFKKS